VLWFTLLGLKNFLPLWIYSELNISSLRGWFLYAYWFSCARTFSFVDVYDVLCDVAGWSINVIVKAQRIYARFFFQRQAVT
jgi:hypothetical protein